MQFAADLPQGSYVVCCRFCSESSVICCRSCLGKLCSLLQVLIRKDMPFPAGLIQDRCDVCRWCCLGKPCCSLPVLFSKAMLAAADLISKKLCYLQTLFRKAVFFAAGLVPENYIVCCMFFFSVKQCSLP